MKKHLFSHVSVFIAAVAAPLLLAGCSLWPQPAADPSRYYVLSTAPAAAPTEADARPDIALSVARIQLPAYLDRTELVFSPAEN
ncbi:MAG: ABC-type transport auxiliary lipoprotein family protein, partial [Puniceicoccales bacterium]|nr:ABC-type transport auxiliary lipoprotein family protein [Puniceicoccales bacterium]